MSHRSLAEDRQVIRNLRVRLAISACAVIAFAAMCFIAWTRGWSGFGKFITLAAVAVGLMAMAADISAIAERKRMIRRLERSEKKA